MSEHQDFKKVLVVGKKGAYLKSVLRSRVNIGVSNIPSSYTKFSVLAKRLGMTSRGLNELMLEKSLYLNGTFEFDENGNVIEVIGEKHKAGEVGYYTQSDYLRVNRVQHVPANSEFAKHWYFCGLNPYIDNYYFEKYIKPKIISE